MCRLSMPENTSESYYIEMIQNGIKEFIPIELEIE